MSELTSKVIFLDTETTSLNINKGSIYQLYCHFYDPSKKIADTFEIRMAPHKDDPLDDEQALSMINSDIDKAKLLLQGYMPQEQGHQELLEWLGIWIDKFDRNDKAWMVGWNVNYDYQYMRKWFDRCEDKYFGSWFFFPYIDLMTVLGFQMLTEIEQEFWPQRFNLTEASKSLGIDIDERLIHEASYDVKLTREIFRILTNINTDDDIPF